MTGSLAACGLYFLPERIGAAGNVPALVACIADPVSCIKGFFVSHSVFLLVWYWVAGSQFEEPPGGVLVDVIRPSGAVKFLGGLGEADCAGLYILAQAVQDALDGKWFFAHGISSFF